jgi:hypothetical protein
MFPKLVQLTKASLQSSIIPSVSYGIFELGRNYKSIQNIVKEKYINMNYNLLKFSPFK